MNINPTKWQVITKVSSPPDGWVNVTYALQIDGVGCLVNVVLSQASLDGAKRVAEALTFVPGVQVVVTDGIPNLVAF